MEATNLVINKLGGRKFILCLMTLMISSGLVAFEKVGEAVYSTIILGTVGSYLYTNYAQKKVEAAPVTATD